MGAWPTTADELRRVQTELAGAHRSLWRPPPRPGVGACFVCFVQESAGLGSAGDPGFAAAALGDETAVVSGVAPAVYEPGLLGLREGSLLEAAVRALSRPPDVLLVNATGRDHPRRCGLAVQLGAVLDVPTVGITHRPLLAEGAWPEDVRGATSPLLLDGELVGYWLRTRRGARPLAVHAGWRTGVESAVEIVLGSTASARTPEAMRAARTAARRARSAARLHGAPA